MDFGAKSVIRCGSVKVSYLCTYAASLSSHVISTINIIAALSWQASRCDSEDGQVAREWEKDDFIIPRNEALLLVFINGLEFSMKKVWRNNMTSLLQHTYSERTDAIQEGGVTSK